MEVRSSCGVGENKPISVCKPSTIVLEVLISHSFMYRTPIPLYRQFIYRKCLCIHSQVFSEIVCIIQYFLQKHVVRTSVFSHHPFLTHIFRSRGTGSSSSMMWAPHAKISDAAACIWLTFILLN